MTVGELKEILKDVPYHHRIVLEASTFTYNLIVYANVDDVKLDTYGRRVRLIGSD